MRWYVLKNRRYEGPFDEAALRKALQDELFEGCDFVLEESDIDNNPFNFSTIDDALKIKREVAPVKKSKKKQIEGSKSVEAAQSSDFKSGEKDVTQLIEKELDSQQLIQVQNKMAGEESSAAPRDAMIAEIYTAETNSGSQAWKRWGYPVLGLCIMLLVMVGVSQWMLSQFSSSSNSPSTQISENDQATNAAKGAAPAKKQVRAKSQKLQVQLPKIKKRAPASRDALSRQRERQLDEQDASEEAESRRAFIEARRRRRQEQEDFPEAEEIPEIDEFGENYDDGFRSPAEEYDGRYDDFDPDSFDPDEDFDDDEEEEVEYLDEEAFGLEDG